MSKIPAISIVMPVYNSKKYLTEAIQSIFAQTVTDWELIAVDDASTDGSWDYLQRIEDVRITVVRNERNLRHPGACNRAIDLAKGKWVARMDADDIILPTRLEKQVAALEGNPQIDVLGCGSFVTDLDLTPKMVWRPVTSDDKIKRVPTAVYDMTYGSLVGKSGWWKRWRLDPRAVESTSFDLFFRSHRESTFGNIPDPLYVYRIGNTTSVKKYTIGMLCRAKTLLRHGYRMGMPFQTTLGLALLVPRPIIFAIKYYIGDYTSVIPPVGQTTKISENDLEFLRTELAKVFATNIPLKS